jgi:hypothetical protein
MVEKRKYETVKEFAKDYRTEIIPMLKSKGFTLSINTSRGSYYQDGRMNFVIKKIPSNFYVWTNEYSRYNKTEKSQKLLNTIRDRVKNLIAVTTDLDIDTNFDYHKDVRYKPIPEGWDFDNVNN